MRLSIFLFYRVSVAVSFALNVVGSGNAVIDLPIIKYTFVRAKASLASFETKAMGFEFKTASPMCRDCGKITICRFSNTAIQVTFDGLICCLPQFSEF